MTDVDKFRVDFASRLFDGESRRKDMIETKAYFQAAVIGAFTTAGIFRYRDSTEFLAIWKSIFQSGLALKALGGVLLLLFVLLFLSIAQALRTRRWHNGVPGKLEELLLPVGAPVTLPSLSFILTEHLLRGYVVNRSINRRKSFWVGVGTACLLLIVAVIAAINVQIVMSATGR